jgi:IS30 family transposase
MRTYQQLTRVQRYQIYALKKVGHTQTEIAQVLGIHKSSICRELKRNSGQRGYRPKQAQRLALARRGAKIKPRISSADWDRIDALIRKDWSPEQISGRLLEEGGPTVSHEWIYQHIYSDKWTGGTLHTHLRCRKKRRKRYGSYDLRGQIPDRVSIEERPEVVEQRQRIGDWEGDTIIGKNHQGSLISVVERKSLFTVLASTARKTASMVRREISHALEDFKDRVLTITFDNGREFAEHKAIAADLETDVYFAHPYASWERGTNENTNGLIRQYFPKSRNLTTVTDDEITIAMDTLNHRPRKSLGFKTPFEVFFNVNTMLSDPVALVP